MQISRIFPADSFLPYYYYDPQDTPAQFPGRSSPYGVDGITVDAVFTAPSGKQLRVPAFYYQEYVRTGTTTETMTATNQYSWKIRFTPEEAGGYTYFLELTDKEGTSRYPATGTLSFTATPSQEKGFIRVSSSDPRFLAYANGNSFVPIGSGKQWWLCCGYRSLDYDREFTMFGTNGVNLARIWDQNDGYNLTVEGHFDGYGPNDNRPADSAVAAIPKGTQMNQRGNAEEDKIIEAAERNGVALQLCSHGDAYWIWDAATYNEGWNPSPAAFDDPEHLNYWKRNFRYRVARWGYSPAVLAWEVWNEHGHVPVNSAAYRFYQTYGAYQKTTDPYGHLRTTSQGSQAYSPAFWSSAAFDIANYHDYLMSSRYPAQLANDEVAFVSRFSWCLGDRTANHCSGLGLGDGSTWQGGPKPWVWGEIDVLLQWNEGNPKVKTGDGRLRFLHNSMWTGLFTPMGTTPIDWSRNEEDAATTQIRFAQKKIASDYFSGVDYDGGKFVYMISSGDTVPGYGGETVTLTESKARAFGMRRNDKLAYYFWVQHRDYVWSNSPAAVPAIAPSLTLTGLPAGSFSLETWNTYSGEKSAKSTLTATAGTLTITLPSFVGDIAVKLESATLPPPAVKTPTIAPITASPSPSVSIAPSVTTVPAAAGTTGPVTPPVPVITKIEQLSIPFMGVKLGQFNDPLQSFSSWLTVLIQLILPGESAPSPQPTGSAATLSGTPGPSLTPPFVPTIAVTAQVPDEWMQFGHDAQRTGYTPQTVATPWKYAWQWNGAGADGKKQAGHLAVPNLVQPITGGGRVYMIAANTVYALNPASGTVVWSKNGLGTLSSTPAYDSEFLYVTSENGTLSKLSASDGNISATFTAGSALGLAPLFVENTLYVAAAGEKLFAVDAATMTKKWEYDTDSECVTPVAFSSVHKTVVVVTKDLYVHTVSATDGTMKWRVKPTTRTYSTANAESNLTEAVNAWPVIAETHDIVFVRYRLDWNSLWDGPGEKGEFPTTNSEIRTQLTAHPESQALFALKLTDGTAAFIPAVGNGGAGDGGYLPMGPPPVIRKTGTEEVAYMIWRNKEFCGTGWCDGREDAGMGEMTLDATTVSGYQPGDMRFVKFEDIQTDEMMYLTASSDMLFHNHWLITAGWRITDRNTARGDTLANPIQATALPYVIWRQAANACAFNASSRYCSSGLYSHGDTRAYTSGFYEYYADSPQGHSSPFAVVSNGMVLVKTIDGGLIALKNGNPQAQLPDSRTFALSRNAVLGTRSEYTTVPLSSIAAFIGKPVRITGTVLTAINHRPKGMYLSLGDNRGNTVQIRIFEKNLEDFPLDPFALSGKTVTILGTPTLYWPEGKIPEIIVSRSSQLVIQNTP